VFVKILSKKYGAWALVVFVASASITLLLVSPQTQHSPISQANPLALTPEEPEPMVRDFIEIMEGCDTGYVGECVVARTGAGEEFPVALRLRSGMVLPIANTRVKDSRGNSWYQIEFNEWIRYPGRIGKELYVEASRVRPFVAPPLEELEEGVEVGTTTKRIVVDRSDQKLYAYVGDQLVFWYPVSTGLSLTPTPRGEFTVYKKMPSRYMQGPLPGITSQYYDLPGVPWDLYFTKEGGTIHGAYWHENFGRMWSHGCVNLSPQDARAVYNWAPVGTPVLVRD
jgi:lipoprotein-anchoring transpeptidase ErfK/SrfK